VPQAAAYSRTPVGGLQRCVNGGPKIGNGLMNRRTRNFAFAVLTGIAHGAAAGTSAAALLDVGSAAPKLSVAEWVQGEPLDIQKESGKKVILVEFWAVWCPPCKESIPRLTRIQKKYKSDLAVIGVTSPDSRGNSPTAIRKFVRDQGDGMSYWIAIDDRDQTTGAYMMAAEAIGIPHAFLVGKDGKIAWQGSPLEPEMENVIEGLIRGTYDPKVEREVERKFQQLERPISRGQWDQVTKGLTEILKIAPANESALRLLRRVYADELKKPEEFRTWARQHIDQNRSNSRAMHAVALVSLFEAEEITGRFPDVALDAARASYESAATRDAPTITVYALAAYHVGAIDRAVALQQEALQAAQGEDRKDAQSILDYLTLCRKLQSSVP